MKEKKDIKSLELQQLCNYIETLSEKAFRGKQIFQWLHKKKVTSFQEMLNIPKKLTDMLEELAVIVQLDEVACYQSKIDGTSKYLFRLSDDNIIETVLMKYKHGYSVCISSQVGCRMGCQFCASTIGGLQRNLLPSEMLEQIYYIERNTGISVSNIVIMGTGEPFDNYDNVMAFIRLINAKEGRQLGQRSITVSTCGIVPKIRAFADANTQVNLAISLHATSDEKRQKIMPISNKYSLKELLASCQYYIDKTNRRITFEYSLIRGVNDTKEEALKLAKLLKGMLCHINLIPINKIEGKEYNQSFEQNMKTFKRIIEKEGVPVTLRRSLGQDIDAACGQLRRRFSKKMEIEGSEVDA